ncbi:glycosyltransferase [Azoarcus sp. DD4]|uniref:glycosyltransferase n=1 Tax=Azoarcus sp. DD4 TaxID=2027405 RepID=UPI00143E01CF|nr:glycosyltransferase [Azoarcus sp. DD4]
MRILSLFVRYGDADYKGAYQALMDFYAGMPEVSVESVLIDTALAHDVKAWIGRRTLMLAGDNRRREFSGWDTAIEHCRKRFADFDLVHLVTSAFQNEYNGFYPLICREMLDYVQATPQVMLAHVDAYPERVRLYGRSFQTWGCSKFLFARPADILALGSLVGPFDEPDFFPAGRTEPFNADAPLSENYARFLLDWLTGSGLPHGQWHSVFRYADENVQKFRAKALSILDEHNLSLRIRESGVRIVDYTWWHANRHRIGDLVPPDELIQVQERNRYLFGSPIVEGQALRQAPFPQKAGIAALLEDEDDELFTGGLGRALLAGVAMPHELTPAGACIARAGMLIKVGYRFSARQLKWLAEVSEELVQDAPLPITRGLHAVWLARDDLHRSLNLDTAEGREALVVWWSRQHREEVDLCVLMPERVLGEPAATLEQDAPLPLTRGLHAEWLSRPDLRQALDLGSAEGRKALVVWWVRENTQDAGLRSLIPESALSEPDARLEQDAPLPLTRGLHAMWLARDDLQQSMDLGTAEGRRALVAWWSRERRNDPALRALIAESVLSEPDARLEQDAPLPLTRGLHAEWLARHDLQQSMDLGTAEGRRALVAWWSRERRNDPALRALIAESVLSEPDARLEQDAPLPLTRGLHAEWLARHDLQQSMDLGTAEGRRALVAWWSRERRNDPALRALIAESVLSEPDARLEQDAPLPLTRGLHAEWLAREDLQRVFDLAAKAGREALSVWWYVTHRDDAFIRELVRLEVMEEVMPLLVQDEGRPITRAEYLLWISREDLRVAFDVKQRVGRKAYSEWLLGYGAGESTVQGERDAASSPTVSSGPTKGAGFAEGGVNVIGYGRGEFGIGEDVRMAVRALSCIDIGTCVPRIPLRVAARQEDVSLRAYEVPRPLFRTNLICMPHYETLRLLAATGHSILDERYNIGFWQWELPRFPAPMRCALDLVDEIWSASSFTAEAMRAVTDKPVIRMPMVATLPAPERKWSRSDFCLNEGEFIFLTVLDGNSSLKRKNPLAAVRAFTAAFPKSKHVRLVVKAMNVSEAQLEWRSVVEHAARDDRISLIVETMTKDKLLGLQSVCDCFVSLHRSEGFGRNIAEAMLLGKPVIVSDYSGNRDFTTEKTAFLVQGRTIPLAQGDYAFGEGQVWFDPDVGAAAEAFHRCLDQAESRMSIAAAGRAFVHARYSPEAVGAAYAKRLAHVNAS